MELLGQIKSKLVPSRKEDPSVRVQIPFDKGLFHSTLAVNRIRVQHGGEEIFYTIDSQNVLNEYLARTGIFVSIMCMGFPYAVLDTVCDRLHCVKLLLGSDISQTA